jgi:hypothetical protein
MLGGHAIAEANRRPGAAGAEIVRLSVGVRGGFARDRAVGIGRSGLPGFLSVGSARRTTHKVAPLPA